MMIWGQFYRSGSQKASQVEGDITDCSPIYMSYKAHWNSLVVTNSILECQSELAKRQSKTIQILL
jgi:hypothetical protein